MSLHRRIAALLVAALAWSAGTAREAHAQDAFELTLLDGWARAITEHGAHWITASAPALEVAGGVYIELGADCRLEVVDAGRGSFVFDGTTSAELSRSPAGATRLRVRRLDRIQAHTMRGEFQVVLPAGQRLGLRHAVTHLRGAVDGTCHIEHVLGDTVELDIGGWYTFELAVGTRRALPALLDGAPAARRRDDFAALRSARSMSGTALNAVQSPAQSPVTATPRQRTNAGVRLRGGLDDRIRSTLFGLRTATATAWDRLRRGE